jgi:hypothetical protein
MGSYDIDERDTATVEDNVIEMFCFRWIAHG